MQKDFDKWNNVKKRTHKRNHAPFYNIRELWWCRIGVNIGSEQDGGNEEFTRPVVIIRGFGPDACLVIPLTTSTRKHSMRIVIGIVDGMEARANLSQIRVIDTKRLVRKIGYLNQGIFEYVRKAARDML